MQIFKKPQKELWLDTLKRDFPIKKPKRELPIMKQDMLYVGGI